jgi:predicted membrane chloride channel (bestrophin family)
MKGLLLLVFAYAASYSEVHAFRGLLRRNNPLSNFISRRMSESIQPSSLPNTGSNPSTSKSRASTTSISNFDKESNRKYKRTVFEKKDWKRHRSSDRYRNELINMPKSLVLRGISMQAFGVTMWSVIVILYNWLVLRLGPKIPYKLPFNIPLLSFPSLPMSLTSPSLGLLLVFRTNTAYERWKQGREAWSKVGAKTFDLVRQATAVIRDEALVAGIARHSVAFAQCLRWHLTHQGNDRRLKEALKGVLTPEELENVLKANQKPTFILTEISKRVSASGILPNFQIQIDRNVCDLSDAFHTCERIFTSPIPISYTKHTARFLLLWLLNMPMVLYHSFFTDSAVMGTFCIPFIMFFFSLFLFGIEELGVQIEEPFGILPLPFLCEKVHKSILELIGEAGIDWNYGTKFAESAMGAVDVMSSQVEISALPAAEAVAGTSTSTSTSAVEALASSIVGDDAPTLEVGNKVMTEEVTSDLELIQITIPKGDKKSPVGTNKVMDTLVVTDTADASTTSTSLSAIAASDLEPTTPSSVMGASALIEANGAAFESVTVNTNEDESLVSQVTTISTKDTEKENKKSKKYKDEFVDASAKNDPANDDYLRYSSYHDDSDDGDDADEIDESEEQDDGSDEAEGDVVAGEVIQWSEGAAKGNDEALDAVFVSSEEVPYILVDATGVSKEITPTESEALGASHAENQPDISEDIVNQIGLGDVALAQVDLGDLSLDQVDLGDVALAVSSVVEAAKTRAEKLQGEMTPESVYEKTVHDILVYDTGMDDVAVVEAESSKPKVKSEKKLKRMKKEEEFDPHDDVNIDRHNDDDDDDDVDDGDDYDEEGIDSDTDNSLIDASGKSTVQNQGTSFTMMSTELPEMANVSRTGSFTRYSEAGEDPNSTAQ